MDDNAPLVLLAAVVVGVVIGWLLGQVLFGLVLAVGFAITAWLGFSLAARHHGEDE
jgi:hypothetical protein